MISSEILISQMKSKKSRFTVRRTTILTGEGGSHLNAAPSIPQKAKVSEQHFFLVASEMRSRIKCLMSDCNDTFVRKKVVFTSFIGNKEDDDILVVLKNGRYLIFDKSGSIVRLEVEHTLLEKLSQYTIEDTLNVMINKENVLKLLMLNKKTDKYFTAELKPSVPRTHYIKSYTIELSIVKDPRQESYRF